MTFEHLTSRMSLDASDYVGPADDAADAGEEVAASTDTMSESLLDVEPRGVAAGAALAGIGTAAQGVLDDTQELRESLGRTSVSMGISSDDANELARSMSDATFPIEDVTGTMDSLARQGVDSEEQMQDIATSMDELADATGTSAESVAENLGPAISALGHDLDEMDELQDAFTVAVRNTTLETEDLAQVMERSSDELREMGLDAEETTTLIAAYADETGKSGRRASRDFAQALREADGDMEALKEETGLSEETIGEFSERLEGADGVTQEYAEAANDSLSTMDRLRARFDDAALAAGGLLEPVSAAAPALQAAGVAAMTMSTINVGALAPSFAAVSTAAAPITAVVLGIAAVAAVLYKAWDSNFLGIQQRTETAFELIGDAWDWLSGKLSAGVEWVIDQFFAIPDAVEGMIDAIPGVDSDDVLGDIDRDEMMDSLFPDKPGEEGEEVGEEAGEGMADGIDAGVEGAGIDDQVIDPDRTGAGSGGVAATEQATPSDGVATGDEPEMPVPSREQTTGSTRRTSGADDSDRLSDVIDELRDLKDAVRELAGPRAIEGDLDIDGLDARIDGRIRDQLAQTSDRATFRGL